ncbi:MAG: ATP-binding cassette domain-containing protein [Patescibacteria group bacterium]|nr:ATP-binding cassette domain-containing protein [Patescibacteria group bacterium]
MPPILSIKNLTKKFKNFKAVNGVSFDVGDGEIFGLLGPNGAGKTTIIRVIATVLAPTSGTAEVLGFDIIKNSEEVRKNIGVLTTDIGVYERFSGRENLRYFGELYGLSKEALEERISELSDLLEMNDFIDRRAGKYSTGMKQKLAIARSVIHNPKIIIFDEPTAGLDVLASQTVLNFMRRAQKPGGCVIFSTHQMNDAEKLCDRVVIVHKGKVITGDTVKALKSKTGAEDLEDVFMKLVRNKFKSNC